MNIIKDYLLDLLKSPRTRAELTGLTNMSDRAVRLVIKELTREGHCIIHDSKTNTYKLTEDIKEIETYLKTIDRYQTSFYFNYLAMRKKVATAKGQKLTHVREHFRRLGVEVDENQMKLKLGGEQ